MATPADLAACRESIRIGSRSFHAASRLLPAACRSHAISLYAFCREADDLIDGAEADDPDPLAALRRRLDAACAGRPEPRPADRALAHTIAATALPPALPRALLEGFAWDREGRRYETIDDVEAYAARVAGAVGAMMTVIMGVRAEAALARACDLGVAMQLSNIVRDVREDAANGRVYLPRRWLKEAGLSADELLATPVYDARLEAVMRRVVAHAARLYRRADAGIAMLPRRCRPAIVLASRLYEAIGLRAVDGRRDPLAERTVISDADKLALLLRSCRDMVGLRGDADDAPLGATAFLVAAASVPDSKDAVSPGSRIVWLIDLFERLERMEKGMARG